MLRLLALVYLVAFLVARAPDRPAARVARPAPGRGSFLAHVQATASGAGAYWRVPTLLWLGVVRRRDARRSAGRASRSRPRRSSARRTRSLQLALWAHLHVVRPRRGRSSTATAGRFSSSRRACSRSSSAPCAACGRCPATRDAASSSSGCCGGSSSASCSARRSSSCATTRAGGTSPASTTTSRRSPTRTRWPGGLHHAPHGVHVAGVLFNHLAEARRALVRLRLPALAPRGGGRPGRSSRRRSSRAGTSRSSTGSRSSRRSRASTTRLFARLLPRKKRRARCSRASRRSSRDEAARARRDGVYAVVVGAAQRRRR